MHDRSESHHGAGRKRAVVRQSDARDSLPDDEIVHFRVNHGERPHTHGGVQFRLRMHDGRRMNHANKSESTAAVAKEKVRKATAFVPRKGVGFSRI